MIDRIENLKRKIEKLEPFFVEIGRRQQATAYLKDDVLAAIDEFIAESRKIPKAKKRKRVPNKSNRIPKN